MAQFIISVKSSSFNHKLLLVTIFFRFSIVLTSILQIVHIYSLRLYFCFLQLLGLHLIFLLETNLIIQPFLLSRLSVSSVSFIKSSSICSTCKSIVFRNKTWHTWVLLEITKCATKVWLRAESRWSNQF